MSERERERGSGGETGRRGGGSVPFRSTRFVLFPAAVPCVTLGFGLSRLDSVFASADSPLFREGVAGISGAGRISLGKDVTEGETGRYFCGWV